MMGILGGLFGGLAAQAPSQQTTIGNTAAAIGAQQQTSISSGAALAAQQQMGMAGLANQVGGIVTYNGSAPNIIPSIYCPPGHVYMTPQGTFASPSTSGNLQQAMEDYFTEQKRLMVERFLQCTPDEREAYIQHLKVEKVRETLYGKSQPQYGTVLSTMAGYGQEVKLSLEELQNAHAGEELEKVLSEPAND